MMKTVSALVLAAAFAVPAFAQESGAVLRVESGSVMVSSGDQFVPAQSGQTLAAGQRVMVAEGGAARLVYPGGCSMTMSSAGVFQVPVACVAGPVGSAAAGAAATTGGTVGSVGGMSAAASIGLMAGTVVAVAAAMEETREDNDEVPVSR